VLLATPVGQMEAVFAALAPHLAPGTIITDGGSTKGPTWSRPHVPGWAARSHNSFPVIRSRAPKKVALRREARPLCRQARGADAAGGKFAADVARLQAVWEACGARVSRLTAEEHDRVFAAVSHLPHLLAFALVHDFAQRPNSDQLFGFAAGGFRDFTRIASSHPEMWRDICVANRHALLQELDAYMLELMRTRVLLAAADADGLEQLFSTARARRDAWLDSLLPPGE
jgi:prephenate dehydrogenase